MIAPRTRKAEVAKVWFAIQTKKTTYAKIAKSGDPRLSLLVYMHEHMLDQRGLGALVGAAQPTVALWLSGANGPSTEMRQKLFELCSIPPELWG